jgi:gag-polyprotein putative aspartyl protease
MKVKVVANPNLLHMGILVSLVFALVVGAVAQDSGQMPDKTPGAEVDLPFRNSKVLDAILVTVRVNGKDTVLIFDTGSNRTILSPEVADYDPRNRDQFQASFPESGAKAQARWGRINLQIEGQTWKDWQVVVKGQDDLSKMFRQKIDGILGKDVLNEFERVTIDFPAHLIRLSR